MMFLSQVYASIWMISSAFLYSLQNANARFSGNVFGFWTMCVSRGVIGSLLCILLLCLERKDIVLSRNIKLLMIRSLLGGATIITSFFAVLKCDLSTATIMASTSPLWTACIGYTISPEKYKWMFSDIVIAIWCFGGVAVLSSDTNHGVNYYIGVVSALLSAIFQSGVNLTIKQLKEESPAWVALWGMIGSVLLGLPGLVYELVSTNHQHFIETTPFELTLLGTTGVLSAAAQYCKTYSIQISNTMSVLIFRHLDAIFSVLWDMFIFKESLSWQTITGTVIVLSGCFAKLFLEHHHHSTSLILPLNNNIKQ